jgi:hypothetical protein
MAGANRAEAIRQIFAAYLANDRGFVETAFSEDFRFTSPYDDNIDKPDLFRTLLEGQRLDRTARTGAGFRRR